MGRLVLDVLEVVIDVRKIRWMDRELIITGTN